MTVYNLHLKNGVKCKKIKQLKQNVSNKYVLIMNIGHIPFVKKVQLFLFVKSTMLYNLFFRIYKIFDYS